MKNRTTSIYYLLKVKRDHIGRLSGILEGLDGIGYSRTIDPEKGTVEISAPISQKNNLDDFLSDLPNWVIFKFIRSWEGD
ncbi:DUF4911 domain-containing protein [bacterium]|nr:DUF4911 domain-containing protein [bacterium]